MPMEPLEGQLQLPSQAVTADRQPDISGAQMLQDGYGNQTVVLCLDLQMADLHQ